MTKTELRKKIKEISKTHEHEFKSESERISNEITSSDLYKNAQIIFAYMALKDEPNIFKVILQAQSDNKKVFIPKTEKDSLKMDFFEINKDSRLFSGNLGVLEPFSEENKFDFADYKKKLFPKKILILVPGRAFTKDGFRLGRGKGYYDNFLKNFSNDCEAVTAGVCFPFQISEKIPTERHDIKTDFVFY